MRPKIRPLLVSLLLNAFIGGALLNAATAPTITAVSNDLIVPSDGNALLGATVTGDPTPILQWRHDSTVIPGATSEGLEFKAALADSGSYTLLARNIAGAATSKAIHVVVVDSAEYEVPGVSGKTVRLRAPTLAKGVSFHWQKDGAAISPSSRISGITSSELVISKVQDSDSGSYTCVVTSPAGSLTSGQQYLVPVTRKPIIVEPISQYGYTIGMVAQSYTLNVEADYYPDSFSITGLPPGLTVNSKTGEVTGIPRKAGRFHVKVTATNALGTSDPVYYDLDVSPLDSALLGTQYGLLPADDLINNGLGGRCTVTMAENGAYTASLVLGTHSFSTSGILKQQPDGYIRGISKLPSSSPLYFWVSTESGAYLTAIVSTAPVIDGGTRSISSYCSKSFTGTFKAPGRYTFSCAYGSMGSSAYNVGWFTLGSSGSLSGGMRMIDGVSITLGGKVTTDLYHLFYKPLYSNTGAIQGAVGIGGSGGPDYDDASFTPVGGEIYWFKKPQSKPTRSFSSGFQATLNPRGYGWPAGGMAAFAKLPSGSLSWQSTTALTVSSGKGKFSRLYSPENSNGWKTFSISGSSGLWSGSGTYRYYLDYYDITNYIDRSFYGFGLMVRDSSGAITCPGCVRMVDLADESLGTTLSTSPITYYQAIYSAESLTTLGSSYTGSSSSSGGITISGGATLNLNP